MNTLFDTIENNEINFSRTVINPLREAAAYEMLWRDRSSNFKKIAELLNRRLNNLPSSLVPLSSIDESKKELISILNSEKNLYNINILLNSTPSHPESIFVVGKPVM